MSGADVTVAAQIAEGADLTLPVAADVVDDEGSRLFNSESQTKTCVDAENGRIQHKQSDLREISWIMPAGYVMDDQEIIVVDGDEIIADIHLLSKTSKTNNFADAKNGGIQDKQSNLEEISKFIHKGYTKATDTPATNATDSPRLVRLRQRIERRERLRELRAKSSCVPIPAVPRVISQHSKNQPMPTNVTGSTSETIAGERRGIWLNVYDLTKTIGWMNDVFLRKFQLGLFHCGIEVYGKEYSFGPHTIRNGMMVSEDRTKSGIKKDAPRQRKLNVYRESVYMGQTRLTPIEVSAVVKKLGTEWRQETYHLTRRNCLTFAEAFVKAIGSDLDFPSWVMNACEVSRTTWGINALTDNFWGYEKSNGFMKTGCLCAPDLSCHEE